MKAYIKNILVILILGALIYSIQSCNKDNDVIVKNEPVDLGILRTDEIGRVLGGDYSDWCIHQYIDTFTTAYIINVTAISNNVNRIQWMTSKQYHCLGFDVERCLKTDTNYIYRGFLPGIGTTNDTITYFYNDTVSTVASDYKYRLKVRDIFGNFKYAYLTILTYPPANYSFGPAYPNPVEIIFRLRIDIPRKDTVSLFFINNFDTIFVLKNEVMIQGNHELDIDNRFNYHNVQKRLYIRCGSFPLSDSCRNYGDIQFN
jgi:hypothetical protein